jgi:hypothetical protein
MFLGETRVGLENYLSVIHPVVGYPGCHPFEPTDEAFKYDYSTTLFLVITPYYSAYVAFFPNSLIGFDLN